jgi:hypothetical protein
MPIKPHRTGRWPPKARIYIYDENLDVIDDSRDTRYDLHDNLMQAWPYDERIVYFGLETTSKNWPVWDEGSIECIESLIEFDLDFDGNDVVITRTTKEIGQPCTQEFIWKLEISQ